jgi:tetratricopeptide (TPR) repeat protein
MRTFARLVFAIGISCGPAAAQPAAAAAPAAEEPGYYFLLGRRLEGEGKVEDAIAAHRRAIALAPRSAEVHAELAGLFARQNRTLDAVTAAEAALERDSSNREANRLLGSIYTTSADAGRPLRPGDDPKRYASRAIAHLESTRRDGLPDAGVELMLGRLHLQAGAFDEAAVALRRVVDEQPGFVEAAVLLASALQAAEHVPDAIAVLEDAVDDSPRSYRALVKLAELYEEQRRWKEAAAAYATAQTANPRVDLRLRRAAALINAGSAAEARALLEAVLDKSSRPDAGALYLLAHAQRKLGDLDAAARTAETLRKGYPDDVRAMYVMAPILEAQGRHAEAAAMLEELVQQVPNDTTLAFQYASVLEKGGRIADAEKVLSDLLARDPLDANALNSLGYMFADRGERLDEAVELLQRALKLEPRNPSFLDSLGWAYFRQGKLDLADRPLSEAAGKLPDNSVVQDHLGDLRFRQQRYPEAAAAWERSLGGDGDDIERAVVEKKLRDARDRINK